MSRISEFDTGADYQVVTDVRGEVVEHLDDTRVYVREIDNGERPFAIVSPTGVIACCLDQIETRRRMQNYQQYIASPEALAILDDRGQPVYGRPVPVRAPRPGPE